MRRTIVDNVIQKICVLLLVAAGNSCGGDASGPGQTPAPPVILPTLSVVAGSGQTARLGQTLPTNPVVVIRNPQGQGVPGIQVTFAVSSGGGTIQNATVLTDASGSATPGAWVLGSTAGQNVLTVSAAGTQGGPVQISATARLPYWTVMVFMAADNNLALSGLMDLEEMESVTPNPDVQVVVQAEFSPDDLRQYGCASPACIGRPNWNTFRYSVNPSGSPRVGPNGPVLDIGNRRMTDPLEVRDFIQWAKQNHPAEKYAFVFWNHGGGYTGLLQDLTSSGEAVMSIGDLPAALANAGKIDVTAFDMCLMAGYETLSKLVGFTDYVVASEEIEPGDGYPYNTIISALNANPGISGSAAAVMIADSYHGSVVANRTSTTVSVYDMSLYTRFENSLNALAATLRANLNVLAPVVSEAASQSQSFSYVQFKDISDFLTQLRLRVSSGPLLTQIDALKTELTSSFRIRNHTRKGTDSNSPTMAGASGLHFVLPSGLANDATADVGTMSFTAYQAILAGKPWTQFLQTFLANHSTFASTDQGNQAFQAYLVWDDEAIAKNADLDIWVLEPSGDLYIPYLGTVTPNGVFTPDSYDVQSSYEGYLTKRFVRNGRYKFYADLYADAQNYRPLADIAYRNGNSEFTFLYTGTTTPVPRLSKATSWRSDPNPTFDRIENGAYTDILYMAHVDYGVSGQAEANLRPAILPTAAAFRPMSDPVITGPQLSTLKEILSRPRAHKTGTGSVNRTVQRLSELIK